MPEPSTTIGVLIVDDHLMFAQSLARLLRDEEDIDVVGIASNGTNALELTRRLQPTVVLVDYQMPEQDGLTVTAEIKRNHPSIRVIMLTGWTEDRVLLSAIDAGCSGFLTKDLAATEVATAVRAAAVGEAFVSTAMLARLLPKLKRTYRSVGDALTDREREVLTHLARGRTNKAIASEMNLSINTIRNYVQSVLTKLDAHSKLEAVSTAVRENIIDYAR